MVADVVGYSRLVAEDEAHALGRVRSLRRQVVELKLPMPGRDPGGFIVTTLLGIVGAFVATYLGQAIGWYRADEGAGFVGAVVGTVILLAIYHFVKRRSARSPRY